MTCPVNVSLSGGYPAAAPGGGAKSPPSFRRSEVYPLFSRQYYRYPGGRPTHSWGLGLVARLGARWGWRRRGGRTVTWFELRYL